MIRALFLSYVFEGVSYIAAGPDDVVAGRGGLALGQRAVVQSAGLNAVLGEDLLEGHLHHQGRAGAVGAADHELLVVEFSHFVFLSLR